MVEEMEPSTPVGQAFSLTVSTGVVTVTVAAEIDSVILLQETDRNLYRAKEGGRNQVLATETQESKSPVGSG